MERLGLEANTQAFCYHCQTLGHKATYCPTIACTTCMEEGHSFKVCPKKRWKRGKCELARAHSNDNQVKLNKLTEEEKLQLRKQGACFRCQQDGHMSRDCPKKIGSTEYGRPAPTLEAKRAALLEGLIGAIQRAGANPTQIVRAAHILRINMVYWFNNLNKLELPISIHSSKGVAEENALVDSGTMENFIDQEILKRLKLGAQQLERPIKLQNINGTFNKTG
jgi:hypothetical protein